MQIGDSLRMNDQHIEAVLFIIGYITIIIAVIFILIIALQVMGRDDAYGEIAMAGDISCSHDSIQTMFNLVNYVKAHKVDAFIFLGDANYKNSYISCSRSFF